MIPKEPLFGMRFGGFFAACVVAISALAPVYSDSGDKVAQSQQRLLTDIKSLASDELEGRGVGLKGLDAAADYIRDQFSQAGLTLESAGGGPFQTFTMSTGSVLGTPNTLELAGPENKKIPLTIN